ncbi:MAG: NUDIX hydrolase [Planctomycetota bacterium]
MVTPKPMATTTSQSALEAIAETEPVAQAGVIAYRLCQETAEGVEIALVSSHRVPWTIAKGHIDPGHSPTQAAATEAFEEAGVLGEIDPKPLGSYSYTKLSGVRYEVVVFAMHVDEELPSWPERGRRARLWLPPNEAAEQIESPELARMIRLFASMAQGTPDAAGGAGSDDR